MPSILKIFSKKLLLICGLVAFSTGVFAQKASSHGAGGYHYPKYSDSYLGMSIVLGTNRYYSPSGSSSASFAFSQTDVTTHITTNRFAHLSKDYASRMVPMVGFGTEFVAGMIYGEFKAETSPFSGKGWTTDVSVGSGIRFVLPGKKFALRLGMAFAFNSLNSEIGRIDNHQKALTIDNDSDFKPTFVAKNPIHLSRYHSYNSTYTYDADYAQVGIAQAYMSLAPKLGLEYVANNDAIIYRLNVGYNFNVWSYNYIYVKQFGQGHSGHEHDFDLNDAFMNYQYTGNNRGNVPYNPNNLFFSFEIVFKTDFRAVFAFIDIFNLIRN